MALTKTVTNAGLRLEAWQDVPSAGTGRRSYRVGAQLRLFSQGCLPLLVLMVYPAVVMPRMSEAVPEPRDQLVIFLVLVLGLPALLWLLGRRMMRRQTRTQLVLQLGPSSLTVTGIGSRDLDVLDCFEDRIEYFSSSHPTRASRLSVELEPASDEKEGWTLVLGHERGSIRRFPGLRLDAEEGEPGVLVEELEHRIAVAAERQGHGRGEIPETLHSLVDVEDNGAEPSSPGD